jgi:hypothetical protein
MLRPVHREAVAAAPLTAATQGGAAPRARPARAASAHAGASLFSPSLYLKRKQRHACADLTPAGRGTPLAAPSATGSAPAPHPPPRPAARPGQVRPVGNDARQEGATAMLTTDERHTATSPAPPSRPRLRLQPDLSARTLCGSAGSKPCLPGCSPRSPGPGGPTCSSSRRTPANRPPGPRWNRQPRSATAPCPRPPGRHHHGRHPGPSGSQHPGGGCTGQHPAEHLGMGGPGVPASGALARNRGPREDGQWWRYRHGAGVLARLAGAGGDLSCRKRNPWAWQAPGPAA